MFEKLLDDWETKMKKTADRYENKVKLAQAFAVRELVREYGMTVKQAQCALNRGR